MTAATNERLNLKQCQVDVWSTREQLCLASAVMRSGDQNWAAVSRTLRLLSTETDRPPDWYSTKNCAIQYGKLLEQVDTPKRKRERNESNETPQESVTRMLTKQRIEELHGILEEEKSAYNQLYKEVSLLETGQLDHCLNRLWDEIMQDQQREDEEKTKHEQWLKEREQKILAIQNALKQSNKGSPLKKYLSKLEIPTGMQAECSDSFKARIISSASENSSDIDSLEEKQDKGFCSDQISPVPSSSNIKSEEALTGSSANSNTIKETSPLGFNKISNGRSIEDQKDNNSETAEVCPQNETIEMTSPVKTEKEDSPITADDDETNDVNEEEATGSLPYTSGKSTYEQKEDCKDLHHQPVLKSLVEMQATKTEDRDDKSDYKFLLDSDDKGSRSDSHASHSSQASSLNQKEGEDNKESIVKSDFDKLLESQTNPVESKTQPLLPDSKDIKTIKKDDDDACADSSSGQSAPPPLSPCKDKPPEEEPPIKDETKKEAPGGCCLPESKRADLCLSPTAGSSGTGKADLDSVTQMDAKTQVAKDPAASDKTEDDCPALDSSSDEGADKKESDKSFTGFNSKSETAGRIGRKRGRKRKIRPEVEPKDEKDCDLKASKLDVMKSLKEESSDAPPTPKEEPKPELKEEEEEEEQKDFFAVKKAEKEVKQERPEGEEQDEERRNSSKAPSSYSSAFQEALFDEDASGDSIEVKDILSRGEKRKLSASEGVASPVISESTPSSPASTNYGDDPDGEKAHRSWKRSIMIIWNDISAHKNASIFLRPITEDKVPGYHSIVQCPTDLQTIKRQIETGAIRTTAEFQRDILLMFLNAKMYNKRDHNVYQMTHEMMMDVNAIIEEFVNTHLLSRVLETPQKNLRRETRESSAKRMEGDLKRKRDTEDKTHKRRK